ncbi:MAG TPA: nodulation protein NfeD [Polyangia bacterium]|jgi:membrane-bound serine protease (ClpP class)
MRLRFSSARLAAVLLAAAVAAAAGPAGAASPRVARLQLEGTIDVASAAFLRRALDQAAAQGADALVVELNTPGGLLGPMEDMVRALLGARVPTVVYVAPGGAHAWSAGAVVTMAGAIAAMHPATSLGAAHPVSLLPGGGGERAPSPTSQPRGAPAASPELQKILNALTEQVRTIARARGRNEAFAERMVRESATLAAAEAVREHVVDLTAASLPELLTAIDGRQVTVDGQKMTLHTAGAAVRTIEPTFRERFLHVLNDPNILLVLIALAALGLLFELQTPGAVLPGVIGGIALLLALYSLSVLPVSWAGFGLLLFGLALLIVDVKFPSHGVLTAGGLVAFSCGALMLVETPAAPALRVSWLVVLGTALAFGGFFVIAMGAAARAHRRPVTTGAEALVGAAGVAREPCRPDGAVFVEGELWRAHAPAADIGSGDPVEIVAVDKLTLVVRRRGVAGPAPQGGA